MGVSGDAIFSDPEGRQILRRFAEASHSGENADA